MEPVKKHVRYPSRTVNYEKVHEICKIDELTSQQTISNIPKLNIKSEAHNILFDIVFPQSGSISVCEIITIFETEYSIPYTTFFLVFDGKIVNKWQYIFKHQITPLQNTVELVPRMRGGNDIVDMIMMPINMIFKPIIAPFVLIGEIFEFLAALLLFIIKFTVWLFQFIAWLMFDLLNPANFSADFISGFITIVYAICSAAINLVVTLISLSTTAIGNLFSSTFWGWDQSNLTTEDKQSAYFKNAKNCRDKKCYLSQQNTIPFSMLFGTILCPPLGVFMEYGMTGWLNILLCSVLTLLFYFPGLIYALLIIYNN
jgi:uncharacterized membrane protein YqaE (UPF0057 family)